MVGAALICVARTHTIAIRKFICQLECDAYLHDQKLRAKLYNRGSRESRDSLKSKNFLPFFNWWHNKIESAESIFNQWQHLIIWINVISVALINDENKAELSDESDENVCISLCDHTIQYHGGLRASRELGHHENDNSSMDVQENPSLEEISSILKREAIDQIVKKEIVPSTKVTGSPSLDQNG